MLEECVVCNAIAVYERLKYTTEIVDQSKITFLFRTLVCSVCESSYTSHQQTKLNKLAVLQAIAQTNLVKIESN